MNKQVLQDVLSSTRLPTPPAIAMQIIEMTSDPNVTPAQLTDLVQADGALSSKILKTVNSAFYGLATPVGSIKRAQIMLGLNAIKSLTLGFSLVESLGDDHPGEFDYPAFWSRSLHAATCAKAIAAHSGCMEPEEALLGGLLQDVGMVILHRTLGVEYDRAVAEVEGGHRKITSLELAKFDITHPSVAATLAERWRFPASLVTTIRYHEQVPAAPKAHLEAVRCVGLAGLGASVLTEENTATALRTYLAKAEAWLKISNSDAESILEEASTGARQFAKLLEVPAGPPSDASEILETARQQLVDVSVASHLEDAVTKARAMQDIDPVTGKASGESFSSMLGAAYDRANESEGTLTVATVDIEGLSVVREQQGGDAGDALVKQFVTLLDSAFSPLGAEIGRLSDDTFGVLLPGIDAQSTAGACKTLVERAAGDCSPQMAVRVGFTTMDPQNVTSFNAPPTLLSAAEQALEVAQGAGGGAVRAFVPRARSAA